MGNTNTAVDGRFYVVAGGKTVRVAKYHSLALAQDASRVGTRQMMVLGDISDKWGCYWVASYRDAAKLVAAGFEYGR